MNNTPSVNVSGGVSGYIICSNPRSGSTFLVFLLRSTRLLGVPYEWFRGDGAPAGPGYEPYPRDAQEQLSYVLRDGTTENGVYGVKMFPEHSDAQSDIQWSKQLPNLRYVHLTRKDILGQAISLSKARQTDSYANWMPQQREPIYDSAHIRSCLNFIVAGEARWRLYFALNGISPINIVYEEMIASPQSAVDVIAQSLNVVDAKIDVSDFELKIQRDATNIEWRQRFLEEQGGLGELQDLNPTAYFETLWCPS